MKEGSELNCFKSLENSRRWDHTLSRCDHNVIISATIMTTVVKETFQDYTSEKFGVCLNEKQPKTVLAFLPRKE